MARARAVAHDRAVRGLFVALAVAGCATATTTHRETFATLTRELPDYAPIPDDRLRVDGDLRGLVGGYTVGALHSFAAGLALAGGVRRDALTVRAEGEADALATFTSAGSERPGPLGGGASARLLRAGAAVRYSVYAEKGPTCHFCGKHSPPTELDRLDVFVEGGVGEEWITAGTNAASRGDLELGAGFELGPRYATSHDGLEMGLRVLVAHSLDSSRVDHPVMLVLGGAIGS